MLLTVLDTETTGFDEKDQIVEAACVTLESSGDEWNIVAMRSALVMPQVPISIGARATHHITDEELEDAPTLDQHLLKTDLFALLRESDVMAAHNLAFDVRMLLQSGYPERLLPRKRFCTWRCALHLLPDAEQHTNQYLRYYLNLQPDERALDLPMHRALPDAAVTAALAAALLRGRSVDELAKLTTMPAMLKTVRFGKYRGHRWEQMDNGFLNWILKQNFDDDVRFTARTLLENRNARRRSGGVAFRGAPSDDAPDLLGR